MRALNLYDYWEKLKLMKKKNQHGSSQALVLEKMEVSLMNQKKERLFLFGRGKMEDKNRKNTYLCLTGKTIVLL